MSVPVTSMMAISKAALNVAGVGLVGDAAEIGKVAWNLWKKIPVLRNRALRPIAPLVSPPCFQGTPPYFASAYQFNDVAATHPLVDVVHGPDSPEAADLTASSASWKSTRAS
jgi:hypothetical protein